MTVEIRELVIKTHIVADYKPNVAQQIMPNVQLLKQQVVAECLKALRDKQKKNTFDR